MTSEALTQDQLAHAPALAGRFAAIIASLGALIAHHFLRIPRLAPIIVPLHTRLSHAAQRFTRLMALLAAGIVPTPRTGRTRAHSEQPRPAAFPIPRGRAFLLITLRHEAACYRERLMTLLAEPATAALLTATPTAGRYLRPLCHMLAIPADALPEPLRPKPRIRKPRAKITPQARAEKARDAQIRREARAYSPGPVLWPPKPRQPESLPCGEAASKPPQNLKSA